MFEFLGSAVWVFAYNYSSNTSLVRAFAYFATFVIASTVSGAHFNPAVTLAVYLQSGEYRKNFLYMLVCMFVQFAGCFFGILASYAILFEGTQILYPDPTMTYKGPDGTESVYYTDGNNLHYGKVFFLEGIMTMIFAIVFLCVKYRNPLKHSDEIIKGLALAFTLYACFEMTTGAGACLNPWFGISQNVYVNGIINGMHGTGRIWSRAMWCYAVAPFCGAILAVLLFKLSLVANEDTSSSAMRIHEDPYNHKPVNNHTGPQVSQA